jgi:hypothetical protein
MRFAALFQGANQGADMATTLPGTPPPDESELNTLPVQPEFLPVVPEEPTDGNEQPVPKPHE